MTHARAWLAALVGVALLSGCADVAPVIDAARIAREYGLPDAFPATVSTEAGPIEGTLVPITLAGGGAAHLFIPAHQSKDVEAIYLRDDHGLQAVRLAAHVTRAEMVRAPRLVASRTARQALDQRSWERDVPIVTEGGVGGLIYDLLSASKQ